MSTAHPKLSGSSWWKRVIAIVAMIFGIMTLFSGGNVLFGPAEAQRLAGDYIPFVVWFNFLAGFLYVAASAGIWLGRGWALGLTVFIAVATALTALGFGFQVTQGAAFEMRTVGALALRFGFWAAIAIALYRSAHRA